MKLPAVAVIAAFAGGILLGLSKLFDSRVALHPYPAVVAGLLTALLIVAMAAAWRGWLWSAAVLSLLCWAGLGCFAAIVTRHPLPAEHVLSRIEAQELKLRTPLRWHGVLRDEPAGLPWGYGFELNLTGAGCSRRICSAHRRYAGRIYTERHGLATPRRSRRG